MWNVKEREIRPPAAIHCIRLSCTNRILTTETSVLGDLCWSDGVRSMHLTITTRIYVELTNPTDQIFGKDIRACNQKWFFQRN